MGGGHVLGRGHAIVFGELPQKSAGVSVRPGRSARGVTPQNLNQLLETRNAGRKNRSAQRLIPNQLLIDGALHAVVALRRSGVVLARRTHQIGIQEAAAQQRGMRRSGETTARVQRGGEHHRIAATAPLREQVVE